MINLLDNYHENIRKEIALEFGLEAGGYNPAYYITPKKAKKMVEAYNALTNEQKEALAKRHAEKMGW